MSVSLFILPRFTSSKFPIFSSFLLIGLDDADISPQTKRGPFLAFITNLATFI
jgi:hypothetical protein